jgi:multiple sugar transport system ATP-binding protein
VARLNPRTQARVGGSVDLVVDTRSLHFFDPTSGAGLYDEAPK